MPWIASASHSLKSSSLKRKLLNLKTLKVLKTCVTAPRRSRPRSALSKASRAPATRAADLQELGDAERAHGPAARKEGEEHRQAGDEVEGKPSRHVVLRRFPGVEDLRALVVDEPRPEVKDEVEEEKAVDEPNDIRRRRPKGGRRGAARPRRFARHSSGVGSMSCWNANTYLRGHGRLGTPA